MKIIDINLNAITPIEYNLTISFDNKKSIKVIGESVDDGKVGAKAISLDEEGKEEKTTTINVKTYGELLNKIDSLFKIKLPQKEILSILNNL